MDTIQYLKDGKIDISDEGLMYWFNKLECSKEDLSNAICKIGNGYNVLTMYLEMN